MRGLNKLEDPDYTIKMQIRFLKIFFAPLFSTGLKIYISVLFIKNTDRNHSLKHSPEWERGVLTLGALGSGTGLVERNGPTPGGPRLVGGPRLDGPMLRMLCEAVRPPFCGGPAPGICPK